MPNIKSAKKRVLVTEKKAERNKAVKSEVKTEVKKFLALIAAGDKAAATEKFPYTSPSAKASSIRTSFNP